MTLPDNLPGHWTTPDGAEMAQRYVDIPRHQLFGGDFTDFEAAHRVAMTSRNDLDFEASLALARDRIRWLSVQLAVAKAEKVELLAALIALTEKADSHVECADEAEAASAAIAKAGGKMPPAGLASTEGLSPSSTESARTPGEHMKRDEQ